MAKVPPKTLAEVRTKLDDKIMEALDFLGDMETWKNDQTRFTHRVSAFLSASESVLFMIDKHAKRYARDHRKKTEYDIWHRAKEDVFRKPDEVGKAKKSTGSDAEWVYLRAARDDTIHIERTDLAHLTRVGITISNVTASVAATNYETETITVAEPKPEPPPPKPDEKIKTEDLWAFKPIEIVNQGGTITDVINPPMDDVVSVCKRHIDKLTVLVEECVLELSTY